MNVVNLISGSSVFSKPNLDVWKFLGGIMLKSSVQNFKHDFTIMWDKHNCPTIWTFFTTTLLGNLDESESESHSVVSDSWQPHGLYRPWNSPGQNTGVGSLFLLQRIFPTQGLNAGLLHCRWILYQLSHKGSPRILEWVAYPFSSGSSRPRNRVRVSCIAGRFFTNWAIREALIPY